MLNLLNNTEPIYALYISTFGYPEVLHTSFDDMIDYHSFDRNTLTLVPVNQKYSLILSSKYYHSYDFINYYATSFYRYHTNLYYKSIYGPVLIIEHNDLQLIPYILLEEINSIINIYR